MGLLLNRNTRYPWVYLGGAWGIKSAVYDDTVGNNKTNTKADITAYFFINGSSPFNFFYYAIKIKVLYLRKQRIF